MIDQLLYVLASLTASAAAGAIGFIVGIVGLYWHKYRESSGDERLRTGHVMAVGVAVAMIALIAVVRLNAVPHPDTQTLGEWWVYPWIGLAFIILDASLLLILRFVLRRDAT